MTTACVTGAPAVLRVNSLHTTVEVVCRGIAIHAASVKMHHLADSVRLCSSSVCRCTVALLVKALLYFSMQRAQGPRQRPEVSLLAAAHVETCVCATLARVRTVGLSMMPRRKSRSMSFAPAEVGRSPTLSTTCCMAGWTRQGERRRCRHRQKEGER